MVLNEIQAIFFKEDEHWEGVEVAAYKLKMDGQKNNV